MKKYNKEQLEEVIKKSINYVDVCRKLEIGTTYGNRQTIKKYITEYNIDTSHFYTPNPNKTGIKNKIPLSNILVKNSKYTHTTNLKNKLYKLGLKEKKCEICGQDEIWCGKKMSLILDHINGINNDNRIENLRIVCPNCNATLDTHGGKNKIKKKHICNCGNSKLKNSKNCKICAYKFKRNLENRPKLEQLLTDVNTLGYSKTGLKYNVSDNCIRKWIKNYKKWSIGVEAILPDCLSGDTSSILV